MSLSSLLEPTKAMFNKFETTEVDLMTLAPFLGHKSARSGAFLRKLTDMRAYNLIDGRGKVKVTEIGRKIALPSRDKLDEANEGMIEAITSIPLWRELYQKFTKNGKELPTDEFWLELRQICGVTPEDAKNKADSVKKAYLEDIRLIKVIKQEEKTDSERTQTSGQVAGGTIPQDVLGRFTIKDVGYVDVRDSDTYELAKSYLKVLAKKLGIKEEG